jgi:hypothetical protein
MFNKIKPLISIGLCTITTCAIAASSNIETVEMINATYCHLTASGKHVNGYATHIGTFTENGRDYSFIAPGEKGKVPLIKKNGRQYIVLDRGDASDEFSFDYTSEYKYILGSEGSKPYCKHDSYPPCLTLSKTNLCN